MTHTQRVWWELASCAALSCQLLPWTLPSRQTSALSAGTTLARSCTAWLWWLATWAYSLLRLSRISSCWLDLLAVCLRRAIHSICHACPAHLRFHCCPALFYMSPSTDFLQCRSCMNLQHFRVGRRMKLCCWYRHALLVRSWQNVATLHGSLHAMALKDNLVLQYYACAYGSLACCPGASTAWTWAQGRPFFLPGRVHKQHQVSCDTETLVDAHGAAGYLMRKYRIWMLHAWGLT